MGGSRQTQSSLTSSGVQLDPSASPGPLCLPSSSCPTFPGGCSCQPQAAVRGGPHGPPLPALASLASCVGDQRGPLDSPPAPPSLLSALQPLEEFSTVGRGDPGGFLSNALQQLQKSQRGPTVPCPALSPCLGTAGTRTGAHTATAGWAVPCPCCSQRDFFPHLFPGLWDECGALEPMLGPGAESIHK